MEHYQREYINSTISIDGRNIPYPIFTANGYLEFKLGIGEKKLEQWVKKNEEIYTTLNQIIALKQSCFLLRHTSHSCGSLANDLYELKNSLIIKLEEKYNFIFDDDWMEQLIK